jgi:hypothetical protein
VPADDLIERLDEFASRLLEDAEREPKKGAPAVTLKERIEAFKVVSAYLDKRAARQPPAGKDDKPAEGDSENEPTILRLARQVNRRRRA